LDREIAAPAPPLLAGILRRQRRTPGVAQALHAEPGQVGGTGQGQGNPHLFVAQQQRQPGEPEQGPDGIADQRPQLHQQRRAEAAGQTAAQRFAEHRARGNIEGETEQQGGEEDGEHGTTTPWWDVGLSRPAAPPT